LRSNLPTTYNHKYLMGEVFELDTTHCLVRVKCESIKTGFLHCLITGNTQIQIARLPKIGDTVAALVFDSSYQVGVVLGVVMKRESKSTIEASGKEKDVTLDASSLKSAIKKLILEEIETLKVGKGDLGGVVTTKCLCHFTGSFHSVGSTKVKIAGPVGPTLPEVENA